MAQLQPLTHHVIVKRLESDKFSPGGIYIPDIAQEKPAKGVVIATGPGRTMPSGILEPTGVSVGDLVYFGQYRGTEIEVNEERLLVLKADDLFCVEENAEAA
jgi:chaperonin GroES